MERSDVVVDGVWARGLRIREVLAVNEAAAWVWKPTTPPGGRPVLQMSGTGSSVYLVTW